MIEWRCDKCEYLHGNERLPMCPECGNSSATTHRPIKNSPRRHWKIIALTGTALLFIIGSLTGSSEFGSPSNPIGEVAWYFAVVMLAGVIICDVRDQIANYQFTEWIIKRIVIGACIYIVCTIGSCAIVLNALN